MKDKLIWPGPAIAFHKIQRLGHFSWRSTCSRCCFYYVVYSVGDRLSSFIFFCPTRNGRLTFAFPVSSVCKNDRLFIFYCGRRCRTNCISSITFHVSSDLIFINIILSYLSGSRSFPVYFCTVRILLSRDVISSCIWYTISCFVVASR